MQKLSNHSIAMAFMLAVVLLSGSFAFGSDLPTSNAPRGEDELENLRSEAHVSLVHIQDKLERRLETLEPTKENLLKLAAILKDLAKHGKSPYDRKAITALMETSERCAATLIKPDPELYFKELEKAQTNAIPSYKDVDHRLFATGVILASIARGMAQRAEPAEKADWFYLAGEAQFAATKSGTKNFEEFLKLASPKDDARIQKAKARLAVIKTLDRGRQDEETKEL